MKYPFLYEINTAAWLYELSLEYGREIRLGSVPGEKWDELHNLGFNYIWLMGVWKRSRAGMDIFRNEPEYGAFRLYLNSVFPGWTDDDLIGSPYSIAGYCPDSTTGTWDDIDIARGELHKRGMKLILDFVPNHTAPDHPWIYAHPEYYFTGNRDDSDNNPHMYSPVRVNGKELFIARGKDPYFPPWSDTAQLNHFNPEMRSALIAELLTVSRHCDGMRCDMAMLVLNDFFTKHWTWANRDTAYAPPEKEFWQEARSAVPDHVLIAEAYWETEPMLRQLGFDYVYDKGFYDRIKNLHPEALRMHLRADMSFQDSLVRFLENHDEARSAAVFNEEQLCPAVLSCATVPGMKLFYYGQLEGKKKRTPVQLRRAVPEGPLEEIKLLYGKVLTIASQEIFRNGTWKLEETLSLGDDSYRDLIAWSWKSGNSMKLVVVNLGSHLARAGIPLNDRIKRDAEYTFHDEFNDRTYTRKGNKLIENGLLVILEAYRVHVFDIAEKLLLSTDTA